MNTDFTMHFAFVRSASSGNEPGEFSLQKDLRWLWKMRLQFSWEPGILGEYMRRKCHRDIRQTITLIRTIRA